MPRSKTHNKESLARSAMELFWSKGYEATSMNDLVQATGVSRHGIYNDFGGKHSLFVAGFDIYQRCVVTPAFRRVESEGAGFNELTSYFEYQISQAESFGLPGPGCLVANTLTETTTHHKDVTNCISIHLQKLKSGFENVLVNESCPSNEINTLSELIVVFTQGLWSTSRVTDDADQLRRSVTTLLDLIKHRVQR